MTRKMWIAIAVLVPATILGGLTFIVLAARAPATFDARGSVTVSQVLDKTCTGSYDGFRSGAQVTVTDPKGVVLAVGQLGTGKASADPATTPFGGQQVLIGDTICEFPFTVRNIPAGKLIYGVTIATRPTIQMNEADLRRGLKLR